MEIKKTFQVCNNNYQRGRKLTYEAVKYMEDMPVLMHDLEYDIYDQLCYVNFIRKPWFKINTKGKSSYGESITEIHLVNEEFTYIFNIGGLCKNGDFECYAPKFCEKE